MKTLTVTEAARKFRSIINGVETNQEEILLMRNGKPIARLVPEPQAQNALEVLAGLCGTLDDDTANGLADALNTSRKTKRGTLNEFRNPWAF